MPKSIPDKEAGLIFARLMLAMHRTLARATFPGEHYGSHCVDELLIAAALIGDAEGRAMTAGKIADFAGVPRPTAIRRLDALVRARYLHKNENATFAIVVEKFQTSAHIAARRTVVRMIIRAGALLSKMDT